MIDLATTSRQFILIHELAEILHVNRTTIYRWISRHQLAAVRIAGTTRIPIQEARKLLPHSPGTATGPDTIPVASVAPSTQAE